MMEMTLNGGLLVAVVQIIAIDVLLGGDNAVVIALACRRLPVHRRNQGILWGVVGAIALRIVLIFFALQLLALPFLKVVGALLLLWIGIKLLQPEDEGEHVNVGASDNLLGAIRTIIVADAVMSVDNVIAVAGAAGGDMGLVVFGIVVSVPIIVWGSKFVLYLMDRFPVFVTFGGCLLGWIAGEMMVTDLAFAQYLGGAVAPAVKYGAALAGALAVLVVGTYLARRGALGTAPEGEAPEGVLATQAADRES